MDQVRNRFPDEGGALLPQKYLEGLTAGVEVQKALSLGRSRFFTLRRQHCQDLEVAPSAMDTQSPGASRSRPKRATQNELLNEDALIENLSLRVSRHR